MWYCTNISSLQGSICVLIVNIKQALKHLYKTLYDMISGVFLHNQQIWKVSAKVHPTQNRWWIDIYPFCKANLRFPFFLLFKTVRAELSCIFHHIRSLRSAEKSLHCSVICRFHLIAVQKLSQERKHSCPWANIQHQTHQLMEKKNFASLMRCHTHCRVW